MRARTLGYVFAALTPVWLLTLLAIQGRFFVSPHTFVEYGPETSRQILGYSAAIRFTARNTDGLDYLDKRVLDETFDRWVKYDTEGLLPTVEPIATDDDGTTGFRQEVEGARRLVINALQRDMRRQRKQGNLPESARRATQVLQMASIAKYSSSYSAFYGSSTQLYAIGFFSEIEGKLPASARLEFWEALNETEADPEAIKRTAMHLVSLSELDLMPAKAEMPTKSQVQMMLANDQTANRYTFGPNAQGFLLAESYRIAYQSELHLEAELKRRRVTALNSSSESKSRLP